MSEFSTDQPAAGYGVLPGQFERSLGRPDAVPQASVRKLEAIDADFPGAEEAHVRPDMKAEALLVLAGVKPAAVADFYGPSYAYHESSKLAETSADAYADLLHSSGLQVYIQHYRPGPGAGNVLPFYALQG